MTNLYRYDNGNWSKFITLQNPTKLEIRDAVALEFSVQERDVFFHGEEDDSRYCFLDPYDDAVIGIKTVRIYSDKAFATEEFNELTGDIH